jgi:poly(A)-specific ribonuclease
MQVNKDNFELLLPRIVNDIKSCDFISIDCEFTGLGLEKSQRNDILDSVQDRYVRVASVASKFLPIQIGIALFSYSPSLERYVAKPYNFYVFPRAGNRQFGLDRSFQCQIGSLEFLESCGFNWNEWIKNGVSFMNKDHEERIKLRLNQQQETDAPLVQGDTLYDFQQET